MNIRISKQRRTAANSLLIALVVTSVLGAALASYLALVRAQNVANMRAQSWNAALPAAESGIEEALTHINSTEPAYWEGNGWVLSGGSYNKSRSMPGYSWSVSISATDPPIITSTGYTASVTGGGFFASLLTTTNHTVEVARRTVQTRTRKLGLFTKAMVAKEQIDLNGNNVATDSFDSSNPLYSTNGLYDPNPSKRKDNGDVATNSGLVNSLDVGNANIWGRASTGPGGSVSVGPMGAVGSKAWNQAGNKGVEPGWSADDMNVAFPDVELPFTSGFSPAGGTLGGVWYKYLLTAGDYVMEDLKMASSDKLYASGAVRLYVKDELDIKGSARIIVGPASSLKIYMGGSSASIGGNGVMNLAGNALNFAYFGLPSNTYLKFAGNGEFTGVIYAPSANFDLKGGGSGVQDFIGASVSRTVTMNGHFKFHYDEYLGNSIYSRGYQAISWDEL